MDKKPPDALVLIGLPQLDEDVPDPDCIRGPVEYCAVNPAGERRTLVVASVPTRIASADYTDAVKQPGPWRDPVLNYGLQPTAIAVDLTDAGGPGAAGEVCASVEAAIAQLERRVALAGSVAVWRLRSRTVYRQPRTDNEESLRDLISILQMLLVHLQRMARAAP